MYRILIVDDDLLMRQAMRVLVGKNDSFEIVAEAGTGERAVEICEEQEIDLIFMDILMPGITGIEAAEKIREAHPDITIYLLSAYTNFELAREALKLNIKEYISKPISGSVLNRILNNYQTEQEGSGQNQLQKLLDIIKQKDFQKVYYELSDITDEIYDHTGNHPEKLVEVFSYIGQSLLNSIQYMEGENRKLEEVYPLNGALIGERGVVELWLFKVMNYVFQQQSIRKYPLLDTVFTYLEDNVKNDIGLTDIVENCAISQGYLSRIFKNQFNTSVVDYLHMRKLNLAKGYFCFTDESIADVAFKLGYNESSYFSKVFKKYEKMTVIQYKNTIHKKSR